MFLWLEGRETVRQKNWQHNEKGRKTYKEKIKTKQGDIPTLGREVESLGL